MEGTKYVNGQKYNTTSGYPTYGYWLIRQNWDETNGWTADWDHAHGTWSASDNGKFIIQLDKLHNGASFAFTGDDIGETYFYRLYEEDRSNKDPNTKFDTTEYWFAATITANADNTLNVSWQQIQKPKNPNSQLVADNREIRFDNTYYAPAQFTIEGAKEVTSVFSDTGKPAPSSFKIKIQEVDANGVDVPNSSLNQTLEPNPQTGKWSHSYESITYRDNAGKDYYFRISEEIPGTNEEITYDTNVYYIRVRVALDETNHKVVATPTAGTFENGAFVEDSRKPVNNFTFENKYTHREVTGSLALSGEKTIHTTQGKYEMQNDDFYVALFSADGERLTNKVGIAANGSFSIGADNLTTANKDALTFTAAGTYTFYVREMTHADDSMVSDIGGFTYDTTRYKVVYTVKEDNDKKGGLACSGPAITKQTWNAEKKQYEDAGTADKAGLDFVNDYDETKIPPEVSITKDGAATSYKDGTASWTVTLKVENLKQGQMIENFIFTDEMTTFKPAGIGAETTIQHVQVAATTGHLVSYDEPVVEGNKVTINFGTLQDSDTVDGTLVYTITYTTKTALTLNGAAVDMGEALEGNGVHVKNSANIHHEFDGKEEDHKAKDDVRFENMVEKNAAEYSANWPVTTPDGENVTRQIVKWTVKLDLKALPDLKEGDTITITDTLSDGLRFVDGDDYVGLGSVLVGDDNEEITSGGPVQDGQTLTWTYKTLTKKVYTLTYYTEVTGAAFDGQNTTNNGNGQSTAHGTVSNDATVGHDGVTVGKDSDTENVETILMEKGSHLIQAAGSGQDDEYQDAYQIDYTIHVNRGSVDLLPDSAGKLTLVDTLPREARLIGQVTFYEGDSYQYGSTSNVRLPDGVASFSLGANEEGETILTCVLPDDQHIVIQYRMTPQNLRPGETVELTNTVEMTGTYQAQTSTTEKIRYFTGSATVTGAKGMLTVAKVDAQNNPLAGASFDLYRIDVVDANTGNYTLAGDPVRVEEEVTGNADGEVVLGRTGLAADTLYYFVENTAPEGYIKSTARHYFMLLSQRTADTARAEYVQRILTANPGDERLTGLTADSVTFGRYEDGAELPVVNAVEETEVLLSAVKQIDRVRENVPQVFQFELVDSNGKVLQKKATTAQGEIAFDALTYDYNDLGKTFTYTIREVDGGSEDYVYDDTQFTAKVTLTWDPAAAEGQRLKATVDYKNGDHAVPAAVFNNYTAKTELQGVKHWNDGSDPARPETVELTLHSYLAGAARNPDHDPIVAAEPTWDKTDLNNWVWKYTGLDKYDQDRNELAYYVVETVPEGYAAAYDDAANAITNTKTTDITVTKNWVDNNNAYNTRPKEITVQLLRTNGDGTENVGEPVLLNAENDWTNTWSALPAFDAAGKAYTYSVQEISAPEHYASTVKGLTITNTLSEKTELAVNKVWVEAQDNAEIRPEAITVELLANGKQTKTAELNAENSWSAVFIDLEKYDADGKKIAYTVQEQAVNGYTSAVGAVTEKADGNYSVTITNTLLTTDLTGAKNWVDSGNAYETRPETVTLTLYRAIENGKSEIVTGFTPVWENTETDTWTWKYSGMPKYDRQGKLYTYTVAEEPVPGYETAYGDNNAITNTLLTTDLTGAKNWVDSGNAYETRPETVTLTLYRAIENGQPEAVTGFTPVWENTETDTWTWKYSGMPKYDRQGSLYTYTVEEEPVPGYETAYGENNAITNTLILTQATVTKNWVDGETGEPLDAEVLPDSITVQLLQNDKPYETGNPGGKVTLTAEDNWTYTWTGLPKFDADGDPYTYTVDETDIPAGYTVRYDTAQPGEEAPDAQAPAGAPEGENAEPAQTPAEGIELTVTNTLHKTEAAFTAKKVYYGVTDKAFTFELKAVTPPEDGAYTERVEGEWDGKSEIRDDGGNLPLVTASLNVDGETMTPQEIDFGATFVYTEPGTYYYTITEKQETATAAEGPQLVNDPSTYLVKVDVTAEPVAEGAEEPGSTLQADVTYTWLYEDMEEDVDEKNVAFYNNEIMLMSLDGGFVEIRGEKRLESDGQPLALEEGQFRFNLYPYAEGSAAQDYLQGEPLATAAVDADGTFTFYYSITELEGDTTFAVVEQNAGQTIDGITHTDKVGVVTVSADGKVDNAGITGENAFVNQSAVSVSVEKVWEDNGLTITHQPVTVTLYADGEAKSTVKVAAGETYTWENLPARNPQGKKIVYTVGEAEVENYTAEITEIEGEATYSYRITNTLNAEGSITIDPTVDKRVEGREGTALTAGEFTFQLADENGEVLSEVTNDADGHVIFDTLFYDADDIGLHTYIIREVPGSDPHFDYDETEIRLSVEVTRDEENPTVLHAAMTYYDAAGETETPAFVNRYYPVILAVQKTSKDGSNDPLPGAVYGLWMVNESGGEDVYLGNQVADENGYMYFRDGVQIGSRYYFKEEFAPDGHTVDEYPSITFVVEKTEGGFRLAYDSDNSRAKNAPAPAIEDGQISEDLQAVVLEFKNGAVGVQDEVTKLYVSKLDENTREPVTGAVLQIIEKSTGTVAYQWTSGTAAQAIERVLNVDTVYILREVTAPEGYDKAEDTEFSFDAYGNLTVHSGPDAEWVGDTTLNLYDTKRDVTITKQVTEEVVRRVDRVVHTVRSIPQTGDGAPIVLVASLSLCGILFIIYLQERKRANRRDK